MWVDNDLTKFAQGTAIGLIALDAYTEEDGSQHVDFIAGNGHVHELYRNPAVQWVDNDLTGFAQGLRASDGFGLDGYSQADGSQHVNFIDVNGHVHELYRNPAAQWLDNDLTVFAQGTPANIESRLDGYSQADGSQHVNFIAADGHVHELYNP